MTQAIKVPKARPRPKKRAPAPAMSKVDARAQMAQALAAMPEESFNWFVLWASGRPVSFPDGTGGFTSESRAAIEQLRGAARAYLEATQ